MQKLLTFLIVLIGWIFSLCLHEFSHAMVAYLGGDTSVREKGYLTFNPLKYTHPVYSIVIPLVFLLLGGIGLPGGAVYIEKWRLRSRGWESAVALAGPLSNLLLALVLALVFQLAPLQESGAWPGLAFLALLQVMGAILNLLPVPPLDGYGALAPFLPPSLRAQVDRYGTLFMLAFFFLLWYVPVISNGFWGTIALVARLLGYPLSLANLGLSQFQFWRR